MNPINRINSIYFINSDRASKLAYGALFVLALPVGLWLWNSQLNCPLPAVQSVWLGTGLLMAGGSLVALGMWHLWHMGGGLPMNPFPPPRIVTSGIYGVVPHPIYLGFVVCCAGAALASGSASALWIVTPVAALGCLSLVLGYEGPDLRRRFGTALPEPWLGLPKGEGLLPWRQRVGAGLAGLIPWAVCYGAVKALGVPSDAFETRLDWEWNIPILPATMPMYASIYLVVPLTFLLCRDRVETRRLVLGGWLATGLNTLLYITVPATAAFRFLPAKDWMGEWLAWEQRIAQPAAGSFPSFHVAWAVICAAFLVSSPGAPASLPVSPVGKNAGPRQEAFVLATRLQSCPRSRWWLIGWLWCLGLCVSCLTTGMHSLADVLAGALIGAICIHPDKLWGELLAVTERLSNSWKAWQLGPVRIMSHGVWSGLAGVTVLVIAGTSAGSDQIASILLIACCALIGAALWAQWVEGSSALLRPFGYYGAILGGLLAFGVIACFGGPVAELMAAFAVAAPLTQAIGRLRCIIQGCCHGRAVNWGIRVTNPHSRVAKLAGFAGQPIHPTALYSILANLIIGGLLLRLRIGGAGPFQIAGLYLLLAGMSRFAEEAYRGEPQTLRWCGLAIYQWLAVGSVLLGMVILVLPASPLLPMRPPSCSSLTVALLWGLVCAFAMSMDFPASNRRFSRLTG